MHFFSYGDFVAELKLLKPVPSGAGFFCWAAQPPCCCLPRPGQDNGGMRMR